MRALGVLLILCGAAISSAAESAKLMVCAVPDAMPRTGKASDGSPLGLDLAVAQLVAESLGRQLDYHWCASASCSWNCVHDNRCEMVVGQPENSGPEKELAWSKPYAGARFGLVVAKGSASIHGDVDLKGKRVGMVAGTVAIEGAEIIAAKTREEVLTDFEKNKLDAAFIDDDFAAWFLQQHPELSLARVAEYVPKQHWNMAFAVRAADKDKLKEIDLALSKLLANGEISKAFAERGVNYRAPFSTAQTERVENSWQKIKEHGELVAAMDPANLPYSSAQEDQPGFDVEIARALAADLGVKLRLEWTEVQHETAIGQLLGGECDIALGAALDPGAMDDDVELAGKVIYSRPYYGTGYLLVTRKDGPQAKSLSELTGDTSRRLGTEAGSIADYELRQRGYLRRLFRTQLATLKSLSDGGIDYAYLWANVGWTIHTVSDFNVQIVNGYVPEDHWNIAVAVRSGDRELKEHLDASLQRLVDRGEVARAMKSYHVPHFPPFGTGVAVAPGDHGPAPQMSNRQKSKQRYSSLERIRSAGRIVIGLDQNDLPFSAAHPEPQGLDYELAQQVAAKLGVTLQVYWAYSSHDSYPSKLASKELCDVMLGVMPDDRFGSRVAFTRPYYYADYRLVRTAGSERPGKDQAVAVEPGLRLHGIQQRERHDVADLSQILAAVVEGREKLGYILGTRGSWLAEERYAGKLQFDALPPDVADRFPICAAVRKNDTDLRAALDEVLTGLAESGEAAAIFEKWHVPYQQPGSLGSSSNHNCD